MAKTKALISFAVTAKLICVFVFAYAKCQFSHDAAFMMLFFLVRCVKKPEQVAPVLLNTGSLYLYFKVLFYGNHLYRSILCRYFLIYFKRDS